MSRKSWVNYHHLYYFKTIAMEGGIAKAAKKLRLGQPTLSTQMKWLEENLGHQLFDRSKRSLQLTDAGRMVLEYANEIFKLGDEMVDSLDDHHFSSHLQVQIGATDTVPKHLTMKIFQKAQESSDCIVSITDGHSDELLRELHAHRLDLVISNAPPPVGEALGFYSKSIARMPVAICGSAKFSRLKKDFPASLQNQPFIMPSAYSKVRHNVEHFFKLHDIHVQTKAEIQDTSLQKLMCSHGSGLIPIALPAAQELIDERHLALIGILPNVYEELWLIAGQRKIQNPIAASIMKDFKL